MRPAVAPRDGAPLVLVVQNSHMAHHPRHHYRIAAALRESGLDARMLAQPDPRDGHHDVVPVEELPERRSRIGRMASGPLTMWRAMRRRPDAVHVVTLELLPWAVAARLITRRPVLYDSNEEYHDDMLHKEWIPRRLRPAVSRLVRDLEPWLGARLDGVTTAIPATCARFRDAGARTELVWNYPPGTLVPETPRYGPFTHDVLLGGTILPDLIPVLVDTAVALRARGTDARWLVAARDCRPGERALLARLLDENGLTQRFDVHFDLPFTEMPRLLRAARVGFVMYTGRAVPQRAFEYMAWGLPFVVSDLPFANEFVPHGEVGLLAAPRPDAYADALATLIGDEGLRRRMQARGPELVRERFNWETESRKLVGLYRSVLGGAAAAAAP